MVKRRVMLMIDWLLYNYLVQALKEVRRNGAREERVERVTRKEGGSKLKGLIQNNYQRYILKHRTWYCAARILLCLTFTKTFNLLGAQILFSLILVMNCAYHLVHQLSHCSAGIRFEETCPALFS